MSNVAVSGCSFHDIGYAPRQLVGYCVRRFFSGICAGLIMSFCVNWRNCTAK